jgi:hypothetical protein
MVFQARLAASKAANRRFSPRRNLRLQSALAADGETVTIHDLSNTGLLLETHVHMSEGQRLDVDLPEIGFTQGEVVWASERFFGCRFDTPVSTAAVSAALLRNPVMKGDRVSDDLAWDALGSQFETPAPAVDTGQLSFSNRMLIIVGTSLGLWAIILWALGLF